MAMHSSAPYGLVLMSMDAGRQLKAERETAVELWRGATRQGGDLGPPASSCEKNRWRQWCRLSLFLGRFRFAVRDDFHQNHWTLETWPRKPRYNPEGSGAYVFRRDWNPKSFGRAQ